MTKFATMISHKLIHAKYTLGYIGVQYTKMSFTHSSGVRSLLHPISNPCVYVRVSSRLCVKKSRKHITCTAIDPLMATTTAFSW